jgi:hypothetical protein
MDEVRYFGLQYYGVSLPTVQSDYGRLFGWIMRIDYGSTSTICQILKAAPRAAFWLDYVDVDCGLFSLVVSV